MHILRQIRTHVTIAALLFVVAVTRLNAQPLVQQELLVDSFTGSSSEAPVVRLDVDTPGYPCLTAAAGADAGQTTIPACPLDQPDADGQGALRFTPATQGTASAIMATQHIPTTKGLRISFVQYQWGGFGLGGPGSPGGADGIALFLAVAPPLPAFLGPQGGALGYASDGGSQGLPGGWLGIGLDAFGSFNNPDWFGSSTCPPVSWTPAGDQISVRGPEHIGYCLLSSSIENGGLPNGVSLRGDSRADSKRRIEVVIDPAAGTYTVRMDPTGGTDFQPVTSGPLPTDYSDPVSGGVVPGLPPRITFGFSASTGSATDFHEVAEVSVTTLDGAVPLLQLTKTNTLSQSPQPGDTFEYVLTPTVTNAGEAETVRIEDTLPAEVLLNETVTATDWNCVTSEQGGRTTLTCSYTGAYPIPAGTVLPAIHVPVAVQGSVAFGTSITNTASVASDDAAAAVAASNLVVALPPVTVDVNGLGTSGPDGAFVLPDGTVGVPYAATVHATGVGAVSWSLVLGNLPDGLGLSPSGAITGTPTQAGTTTFVLRATDTSGAFAPLALAITIAPAGPALSVNTVGLPAGPGGTFALPGGTVGVLYSSALAATGGTGAIIWALDSGAPPAGLTLNPNGTVTGTPTAAGTASFVARATDTLNATVTVPLSIVVAPAPIVINTGGLPAGPGGTFALPGGTVGVLYSSALAATGGTGTITWSLDSGTPPVGLTLNPNGTVTGTPTTAGTASFVARATDTLNATVTVPLSIVVAPAPIVINTGGLPAGPGGTFALPGGTVGVLYSSALAATGGTGAITWALDSGAPPAGLTLNPNGTVTGTPTTAGTASFVARATDTLNATVTVPLSIVVAPAAPGPLTIVTTSLPGATPGTPYSVTLAASGGTGPITWALTQGRLPAGLTLSAQGVIAGTPTAVEAPVFQMTARSGNARVARLFSIRVTTPPLVIKTTALPSARVGVPYQLGLVATGGQGTYSWRIAYGSLPSGLTLGANGIISGTPSLAITFGRSVGISVTDAVGQTTLANLNMAVSDLRFGRNTLIDGSIGSSYLEIIQLYGYLGSPTVVMESGALPPGLALTAASAGCGCARITGTPTAAGTFTFTLKAIDGGGFTATQTLTVRIMAGSITILGTAYQGAVAGQRVSVQYGIYPTSPGVQWAVVGGALPPGLTFSPTGLLSGTIGAGTGFWANYQFTIRATDVFGRTAEMRVYVSVIDLTGLQG